MRKGDLTREQAIERAGLELVEKVEGLNCDFTGRLQTDGDKAVEFSAGTNFIDQDGYNRVLTAYYYQDPEDLDENDFDDLDWEISGYEIC